MNTTIQALLGLYVSVGGNLTDAYSDIADGIAVGDYSLIPDCIKAVAKVANGTGVKQMHYTIQASIVFPVEAETDMTVDEVFQVFENGGTVIAIQIEDGKLNGDVLSPYFVNPDGKNMSFVNPNDPRVEVYWDESSQKWLFDNR